jgi:hypothetical protein
LLLLGSKSDSLLVVEQGAMGKALEVLEDGTSLLMQEIFKGKVFSKNSASLASIMLPLA